MNGKVSQNFLLSIMTCITSGSATVLLVDALDHADNRSILEKLPRWPEGHFALSPKLYDLCTRPVKKQMSTDSFKGDFVLLSQDMNKL